jgi:hypothetical protein
MSGYTLEFSAMEVQPANFIDAPAEGNPFDGMGSATETIVAGTDNWA